MVTEPIILKKPTMFQNPANITEAFIDGAIEMADKRLLAHPEKLAMFTPPATVNRKYPEAENKEWTSGLNTGILWLMWELTGDKRYFDAAESQIASYYTRLETKAGLMGHDVGFVYTPSIVAHYKLTGDTRSRDLAIAAAEHLATCYSEKAGLIKRSRVNYRGAYRTLVDTMMNIPLLFWAAKETGNKELHDKAVRHYRATAKYLVRADGSTNHHFQFEPETWEPIEGVTLQGYNDSSCWSRGHSWTIIGYPIAYGYTKDEDIKPIYRAVTYHMLNSLPSDYVPYWDLVFGEGSTQPRDSSALAVSICGMREMNKYLDDTDPDKQLFKNASDRMMQALIQRCANLDPEQDGLLAHVTHALPQGWGIDEGATYGDYFYLEALMRYKNPDWQMYW